MKKFRTYFYRFPEIFAALILTVAVAVCSVTQYFLNCADVRDNVLRLHVIAASDSDTDQEVKLNVRDAVLARGYDIFNGSVTAQDAEARLTPYLEDIEKTADEVLSCNGCDYSAKANIVYEYFDTREYDGVTLPAGKYRALKIVLGEGKGKNWWCVMFPPLCLPAATAEDDAYAVFNGAGADVVSGEPEYEIRFKIVELFEKAIEKVRSRTDRTCSS